jgi:hypothetical protein
VGYDNGGEREDGWLDDRRLLRRDDEAAAKMSLQSNLLLQQVGQARVVRKVFMRLAYRQPLRDTAGNGHTSSNKTIPGVRP